MKDSQELRVAFQNSIDKLNNYIIHGINDGEKDHAKLISATISNYTRLKAVEAHEDGLKYAVNRTMASNAEDFKKLVRKSLPEYAGQ